MSNEMLQLAEMLEIHRIEVELLNNKIDDLQAYKDFSIYLVNRVGFDSIESIVDYVGTRMLHSCVDTENKVLRNLLSARWSKRDRPMEIVISDLIEMKTNK